MRHDDWFSEGFLRGHHPRDWPIYEPTTTRPLFVPPTMAPAPAGCVGFVRRFARKSDGHLRQLIERLETRADRGDLSQYQLFNDERQIKAARHLLIYRQHCREGLHAFLAKQR